MPTYRYASYNLATGARTSCAQFCGCAKNCPPCQDVTPASSELSGIVIETESKWSLDQSAHVRVPNSSKNKNLVWTDQNAAIVQRDSSQIPTLPLVSVQTVVLMAVIPTHRVTATPLKDYMVHWDLANNALMVLLTPPARLAHASRAMACKTESARRAPGLLSESCRVHYQHLSAPLLRLPVLSACTPTTTSVFHVAKV